MAKPAPLLHVATYRHHHGVMPDWKRLGEHVVNRRIELKMLKRDDLATASGISYRILGDIETGRRDNFDRHTLTKLEHALQWAPGSAAAIVDGGNPTPAEATLNATAALTATATVTTASPHPTDDAVIRVMNSPDLDDQQKAYIVRTLITEQQRYAEQRVAELIAQALADRP